MSEQAANVKCPLCEGQGNISPLILISKFSNPELRKRLETRIAEIAENANSEAVKNREKVVNFQKEVHNWNPALPIWRRSPKE